jgi:hypothetical protein
MFYMNTGIPVLARLNTEISVLEKPTGIAIPNTKVNRGLFIAYNCKRAVSIPSLI